MGKSREAGILLHPSSLPSPYGIGDLGKEAYLFLEFLKDCKLNIWQILPLGPVGYGNSPYQSYSAFAGNLLLISIELLIEEGLLPDNILADYPLDFDTDRVDFPKVNVLKNELFRKAFERFSKLPKPNDYSVFLEENKLWLNKYALFMSAKNYFNEVSWNKWDQALALREDGAINYYCNLLKKEMDYHIFLQYKFFQQWNQLKSHADSLGIKIVGDLPIFVSYDSCDVWANPQFFDLDNEGNPNHVAGVPPDYFSESGQYWGNPLYKWSAMAQDDYFWWQERFKNLFKLVDIVRIDHFRGFEAYWQIPATEKTAIGGKWVKGPGANFFSTIEKYLGSLPVIAEDLGFITSDVHKLRNRFNYPGMQILQFAFEGDKEAIEKALDTYNMAVYTGTHDNDTALGWYRSCLKEKPKAIKNLSRYGNINLKNDDINISWELIELAFKSKGKYVIIPLQDVLSLDSTSRMNYPGTIGDENWSWRFKKEHLNDIIINKLKMLSQKYIH